MHKPQTMDRGIRIMGGCILIGLCLWGETAGSVDKIVAIVIGLYGLLTGIINFCPLGYFILKEKRVQRKRDTAGKAPGVGDVAALFFFEGMNDGEISTILEMSRLREYSAGHTVIEEDRPSRVFAIIYSGQFKIVKTIAEGETKIIGTVSDGETYGELSFFDDAPPSVAVVSIEDAKVLEVDGDAFSDMIGKNPTLGLKILTRLLCIAGHRMRMLDEQVASLGNWVVQSRQHSDC